MNSIRMGMISAAVATLLAANVSRADIVTYSATGLITQADSVTSLPGANVGDSLSFLFSVDTSTQGIDLGPGQSFYQSAIISASAEVGQYTAPVDTFGNTVLIAADVPDGVSGYGSSWLGFSTPNTDSNFTGSSSGFQLLTAESGINPSNLYQDASLLNGPLQSGDANFIDQLDLQFDSVVGGVVSRSDIIVGGDISIKQVTGATSAPEIDLAPAAGALTLLAGFIAILRGRRTV